LDVYAHGSRLHVLTAERAEAGAKPRLQYVRSADGGETWSAPVPVGEGQPTPDPVKRGNDAQVVATGDRLFAVWTVGAATRMGRGPLAAARSDDGGRTWTPATSPSDSKLAIDHAFVDLAADDAGNVHCVWLDGRHGAKPDGTIAEDAGKGLRYARSTNGGRTWTPAATLDPQCCECCWNSLLVLPGGVVHVLYRDRDPRDMAMVTSPDGGRTWGKPTPVGAFAWDFTGCPHVGGALIPVDETGKRLVATVWTAKGGDDVGTFAVSSADGGKTWTNPARLGGTDSNRPDVASRNGTAVAVWDEHVNTDAESGNVIFYATSADAGTAWSKPVRLSAPGASATHPRVVAAGNGFRVLWTQKEPGKPATWKSVKVGE
jgi:Neuraminidase (sialidase)